MEDCLCVTDSSVLDLDECSNVGSGIEVVKDNDVECVNETNDDYEGSLRCAFDQVLSVFLKEMGDRGVVRPVPAVFGDSQDVDLFKLFCVVRENGGYGAVSANTMWSRVAKEVGLGDGAVTGSSLKLVYYKYLNELEIWFRERCKGRSLGNGNGSLHLLSVELEREFRGLLLDGGEQKDDGDGTVHLESDPNGMNEYDLSDTKDACTMHSGTVTGSGGNEENGLIDDDQNGNLVLLSSADSEDNDRKIKRLETLSLSGMLNWMIQAAKQIGDVSIGEIPGPAKWKKHEGNEFWFQAIKVREALMLRRDINPKAEELLQQLKKLRMHPLLYEDNIAYHSQGRLRCRGRHPHSTKCSSCVRCDPAPLTQSNITSPCMEKPEEKEPKEVDLASTHERDEYREKDVSIGPLFQADVPEWTGEVSDSDDKWLGTRLWPSENDNPSPFETDMIGRGRPDFCGCHLPGSVQCVRFHIAEARFKLKKELGSLFFHWRFNRMGEEICLQWTAEEEKRFKALILSKYTIFWNEASKWFYRKTRENLVSYYLNIFLIKRRSYQNRATPTNIDSDDDETDFGSFSEGFGDEAIRVADSSCVTCSQNEQQYDLE